MDNTAQRQIVELLKQRWPQTLADIQCGLADAEDGVSLKDSTLRRYLSLMAKAGVIDRLDHGYYAPVGAKPDPVPVWLVKMLVDRGGWLVTRNELQTARKRTTQRSSDRNALDACIEQFCAEGLLTEAGNYYHVDLGALERKLAADTKPAAPVLADLLG